MGQVASLQSSCFGVTFPPWLIQVHILLLLRNTLVRLEERTDWNDTHLVVVAIDNLKGAVECFNYSGTEQFLYILECQEGYPGPWPGFLGRLRDMTRSCHVRKSGSLRSIGLVMNGIWLSLGLRAKLVPVSAVLGIQWRILYLGFSSTHTASWSIQNQVQIAATAQFALEDQRYASASGSRRSL